MRTKLLLGAVLAALVGCNAQPYVTEERLERGLVIVLPGIEGRSIFNESICHGLDAGGVDWAIELYDWTSPLGPLYNLRAQAENRIKATVLARRVAKYQRKYPRRPVVLVGMSGGGAIAVWTAEAMPAARRVDGIIMLAPTLSREYDLSRALALSRRGAVSFYSALDWIFLGVGTTVYGTMDARHAPSAGSAGFAVPAAGRRAELYHKLHQISWKGEMVLTGHAGGHLTSGSAVFVARYVAPFVLSEPWNWKLVTRVLRGDAVAASKAEAKAD